MALKLFRKQSTIAACIVLRQDGRLMQDWKELRDNVDEFFVMNCGAEEQVLAEFSAAGIKIIHATVINDLDNLRKKALETAGSDWVFILNSDEVLPENTLQRIKEMVNEKNTQAYTFDVRNYVHQKGSTIYSNYIPNKGEDLEKGDGYFNAVSLRLFRNYDALAADLDEGNAQVAHSGIPIHNYSSLKTLEGTGNDMELEVAEDKLRKNRNCINCFIVGNIYLSRGDLNKAIELLHEANSMDPMNVEVHNALGIAYFKAGNHKKALKSLTVALRVPPNDAKAFTNRYPFATLFASIGAVLTRQERYTKAIIAYEKAIKMGHPQKELLKDKLQDLKRLKEEKTKFNYRFTLNE